MTSGGSLGVAARVVRRRPATWPLALVAFFVRGGALLVVGPLLVLPSAVGIGNIVVPALTTVVFGGITWTVVAAGTMAAAVVLVWVVAGGWIAAAAEAEGIRLVTGHAHRARGAAWPIVLARWLTALPFVVAVIVGATRLVSVAYAELTLPSVTGVPVALRVAAEAPEALLLIVVGWSVTGLLGGLAARAVVLGGRGPLPAVGVAAIFVVRHPLAWLVGYLVPLVAFVIGLVVAFALSAIAADLARTALLRGAAVPSLLASLALVTVWAASLVVVAVLAAWRATALTVATARTFGGEADDPRGVWRGTTASGTMADLRPRGVDPDPR